MWETCEELVKRVEPLVELVDSEILDRLQSGMGRSPIVLDLAGIPGIVTTQGSVRGSLLVGRRGGAGLP